MPKETAPGETAQRKEENLPLIVRGVVRQGKGIASGRSVDPETGFTQTIPLQMPHFAQRGVPVDGLFPGTINVDIAPEEFEIRAPDYRMNNIRWWPPDSSFAESFVLVEATVRAREEEYRGFVYYPLPSEVKSHPDTTMEIIAEPIPGLQYGDPITIIVHEDKVGLKRRPMEDIPMMSPC